MYGSEIHTGLGKRNRFGLLHRIDEEISAGTLWKSHADLKGGKE
jgi:hypothetical protein